MESEANAVGVVGVVNVRVAVAVHIAEVVGVAPIRRTLPPPACRTRQQYHDRTRISVRADS
jgi:hypothetical protein